MYSFDILFSDELWSRSVLFSAEEYGRQQHGGEDGCRGGGAQPPGPDNLLPAYA